MDTASITILTNKEIDNDDSQLKDEITIRLTPMTLQHYRGDKIYISPEIKTETANWHHIYDDIALRIYKKETEEHAKRDQDNIGYAFEHILFKR